MSDFSDMILTEAALGALDSFSALLMKSDLGLLQRRSIVQIAWDTCRDGDALLSQEDPGASLSASEIALAELGAICIAAAIEAQVAGGRRPLVSRVPRNVAPWEWIRWRVDACARAARTAGVEDEKCESLRNIGATLLEPYRLQFQRVEQKELAALQKHQAEQQRQKEQEEQKQVQQQRIEELKKLKENADPEMREALDLEMKELQSQAASGIPQVDQATEQSTEQGMEEASTGSLGRSQVLAAGATSTSSVRGPEASVATGDDLPDRGHRGPDALEEPQPGPSQGSPLEGPHGQVKDEAERSGSEPREASPDTTEQALKREPRSPKAPEMESADEATEKVKVPDVKVPSSTVAEAQDPSEAKTERAKDLHSEEAQKSEDVEVKGQSITSSSGTLTDTKTPGPSSRSQGETAKTETEEEGQRTQPVEKPGRAPGRQEPKQQKDVKKDVEVEKSRRGSAVRASGAKEGSPANASAGPSMEVAKVLWVEPSGKSGAEAVWMGPLSAREVLHMAEERSLGPDGLVWGINAIGEAAEKPPADGKGAQPLWQCLPELGQQLRRASEVQLQQQLEKRFKTMPRQEDATDVLPP